MSNGNLEGVSFTKHDVIVYVKEAHSTVMNGFKVGDEVITTARGSTPRQDLPALLNDYQMIHAIVANEGMYVFLRRRIIPQPQQ